MSGEYIPHTEEYKGHRIEIVGDPDPESPREWDNLGTMTCLHSRYDLGDKHSHKSAEEIVNDLIGDEVEKIDRWVEEEYHRRNMKALQGDDFLKANRELNREVEAKKWEAARKRHLILNLYLYDHSGISMSCDSFIGRAHHAEWDSGRVGIIHVSHEKILAEYGGKRITKKTLAKAEKCLRAEVETYDQYLRGEVYGYRVFGPEPEPCDKCNHVADREEVASCWGFFGDYDNEDYSALSEARGVVDSRVKEAKKEAKKKSA